MMKFLLATPAAATLLVMPAMAQNADNAGKARANFLAADKNKDGKLSQSEFKLFIDANARDGLGRAGKIKQFGAYGRAFNKLDANKDGQISPKELAAARKG